MEKLLSLLLFLMLLCIPQEAGASEIAYDFDAALAAKKLNGVTDAEYGLTCNVPDDAVVDNKFSSPFNVTLSYNTSSVEDGQLLYSLDGTVPSLVYESGTNIKISNNTILRYALVDNGTILAQDRRYFVDSNSKEVEITMNPYLVTHDEKNVYYYFMTYVAEKELFIDNSKSDPKIEFCIIMNSNPVTDADDGTFLKLAPVTYVPKDLPVLIRLTSNKNLDPLYHPEEYPTFTVYEDDSKMATYEDGKYNLNGNTFTNYLHYYETATDVLPRDAAWQSSNNEYYYGLTYKYWDEFGFDTDYSPCWKQITSGNFKARKAFLKTNAPLVDSSGGSTSAKKVMFQFDGAYDLVMPSTDETVTQVERVQNTEDSTTTGVYTLQGIRLAVDASALQTLPKGIYIVNGKKFLVK